MAAKGKQTKTVEDATIINPPTTQDDMLAFLSDEEKAEMLALTGQASNLQGERIPVIKVNYCDTADIAGNTIKKGNFVYDQSAKTVEVEETDEYGDTVPEVRMENLGVDLGKAPSITILAYRNQYNYYSEDTKKRCSSQQYSKGETPVGSTLQHECLSGTCPRRAKDVDKKEKCVNQFVLYCLVDVEGEKKPAVMYVKGTSYFPFNDYLKSVGDFPMFCAPTKLKTSMDKQGSVTYYTVAFSMDKALKFSDDVCRTNFMLMKDTVKGIEEFKKRQFQKQAQAGLAAPTAGAKAKLITSDLTNDGDDSPIQFD